MLMRVTFLLNSRLDREVRRNETTTADKMTGIVNWSGNSRGTLAAIYEPLNDGDRQLARELGLSIEHLTLQKFFSYLVGGGH